MAEGKPEEEPTLKEAVQSRLNELQFEDARRSLEQHLEEFIAAEIQSLVDVGMTKEEAKACIEERLAKRHERYENR